MQVSERKTRHRIFISSYALNRNKLVPLMIEEVELPFRFAGLQTLSLFGWDGSTDFSEFRWLVADIAAIVSRPVTEAKRKADHENRRKDIASRLVDYVADKFKKETGRDLRKDPMNLPRLKKTAEEATIKLYSVHNTEVVDFLLLLPEPAGVAPIILKLKLTRAML